MNITDISKLLSFILRHDPGSHNIKLDSAGWVTVKELLEKLNKKGKYITIDLLEKVVKENNKKRFEFSEDKTKIRASQGHSIDVDLGLKALSPPNILYHGTTKKFINSIMEKGIIKGSRHHVHLSEDCKTAVNVGKRHGTPVVLEIDTKQMKEAGYQFYKSTNGVWLVDIVPPIFIKKLN